MKRYIFPLFMFVLLLGVNKTYAQAKTAKPAPQKLTAQQMQQKETTMTQHLVRAYDAKLSLTPVQHQKVSAIVLNYMQANDEQRTGMPIAKEVRAKNRADMNTKIQAILTPEQNQKFQYLNTAMGSASKKN